MDSVQQFINDVKQLQGEVKPIQGEVQHIGTDIEHPPLICPYCGSEAHLQDSAMIYGKSYGMVYLCDKYPRCDSWVGVHKGTVKPLGTIANVELRELRKQAHTLFDRLWKRPQVNHKVSKSKYGEIVKEYRTKAYSFLADRLQIPVDQCHIAMMDNATCQRVVSLLEDCQISIFD